eukprot:3526897-Amphidinium_carterae.2
MANAQSQHVKSLLRGSITPALHNKAGMEPISALIRIFAEQDPNDWTKPLPAPSLVPTNMESANAQPQHPAAAERI